MSGWIKSIVKICRGPTDCKKPEKLHASGKSRIETKISEMEHNAAWFSSLQAGRALRQSTAGSCAIICCHNSGGRQLLIACKITLQSVEDCCTLCGAGGKLLAAYAGKPVHIDVPNAQQKAASQLLRVLGASSSACAFASLDMLQTQSTHTVSTQVYRL